LDTYVASLRSAATEIQFELAALARLPEVGQIIQPASPAAPSGPDHILAGGAGLLVGLVLGFGYAGIRGRRDDRIASAADLEATVRAPVLGSVPVSRVISWRPRRIDARRASSRNAETYRIIRTNLLATAEVRGAHSIVVTSASSGRSSGIISVNLALILAQAGKRVALVAADTRSPRVSKMLGLAGASQGLTDVLTGDRRLTETIVPLSAHARATKSFVLPPGTQVDDPAAILGSEQMGRTLDEIAAQGAEFVLIDAPPVLATADAAAVARLADAVLLVVDPRHTTHASLEAVLRRLEQVDAEVLGVVEARWSLVGSG
jgi:capsular exopolysaccharide synthesis family protein